MPVLGHISLLPEDLATLECVHSQKKNHLYYALFRRTLRPTAGASFEGTTFLPVTLGITARSWTSTIDADAFPAFPAFFTVVTVETSDVLVLLLTERSMSSLFFDVAVAKPFLDRAAATFLGGASTTTFRDVVALERLAVSVSRMFPEDTAAFVCKDTFSGDVGLNGDAGLEVLVLCGDASWERVDKWSFARGFDDLGESIVEELVAFPVAQTLGFDRFLGFGKR